MRKIRALTIALTGFIAFIGININPASAADRCNIAWSHYTGWEPVGYIQDSGIAARWGKKYGVDLRFTLVNDYVESINQYTAGSFDGVTVTNMDALTIPAVGGVDTTFVVVGDFSNGNDGILLKGPAGVTVKDLKGKQVKLVELSVSHYLMARALEMHGLSERDVSVVNTSDADLGSLIATAKTGEAFTTWNPILMTGRNAPGTQMVFDSSKIPGEIIDGIAVRTSVSDACKKAVTGAWYESMTLMSGTDSTSNAAIEAMAKQAGGTVGEFRAQLRTTAMFYRANEAVAFVKNSKLKETMNFVRTFSFGHGLFGQGASSVDVVGINFPDGSTLGNPKNVKLRFDSTYMQAADDGKL